MRPRIQVAHRPYDPYDPYALAGHTEIKPYHNATHLFTKRVPSLNPFASAVLPVGNQNPAPKIAKVMGWTPSVNRGFMRALKLPGPFERSTNLETSSSQLTAITGRSTSPNREQTRPEI